MTNATDLTTQTPVEIDTLMVEKMLERQRAERFFYRFEPKYLRDYGSYISDSTVAEAAKAIEEYQAAQAVLDRIDAEYYRRGTWARYHIVPDGHVHREVCHTLHRGIYATDLRFIPAVSGMDDDALVATVGETACTCCFKDAPSHPAFVEGERRSAAEKVAARNAKLVERRARLVKAIATKEKTLEQRRRRYAKDWGREATDRDVQWEIDAIRYAKRDLVAFDRKYPGLIEFRGEEAS